MARRPATVQDKSDEKVEVLDGRTPEQLLKEQPEDGPTEALAKVNRPAELQGVAKEVAPDITGRKHYRVLVDRHITGASGQRSLLRAGKELDSVQYDIKALQRQGVKLEEIPAAELVA